MPFQQEDLLSKTITTLKGKWDHIKRILKYTIKKEKVVKEKNALVL